MNPHHAMVFGLALGIGVSIVLGLALANLVVAIIQRKLRK